MTLARALGVRHEVHIAAPRRSPLYREARSLPRVSVLAQPFPNGLDKVGRRWAARARLRAYLCEHRFDIVHVNGSADHRMVVTAGADPMPRPRIVFTKHNSKSLGSLGHWWRALSGTDQVIAACEHTRVALAGSPYRRCRLDVVPHGIDVQHFHPWPKPLAQRARERWIDDPEALVLGSVAGTAECKGWMDLVEAVGQLPEGARRSVHLLLAGHVPAVEVLERVAALGLASQVHFTGLVRDVRPVVAAMDAGFVLSWGVETTSFACREMMAMGKPVLISDYAGLADNIVDGEDGWLAPVRDRKAMAARVTAMLDDRDRLARMGRCARHHACRAFTLDAFVTGTEAVYTRLRSAPEALPLWASG